MTISLNIFILIYVVLFNLAPILILFYIPNAKKYTRYFILNLWLTLYLLLSATLTLLQVSITKTDIIFHIPQNYKFFDFNYAGGMNVHNLVINIALSLPLGVICFYKNYYKNKNSLSIFPLKYNPCFVGLIYALVIELFQGILPTGRFFDVSDFFFDSLFPCFSFFVCFVYNEMINIPLKYKLNIKTNT